MNAIRRMFLRPLALAIVAAVVLTTPASTQSIIIPPSVQGVAGMITADNTDIALLCKFVGPSTGTTTTMNSGKIEVLVTSSNIVFTSGAQGAEAADTSLECPVSGALGGIIVASNAACNTVGEVLDIVNTPTSNFRCVALDSFRSDVIDARLVTMASTRATSNNGLGIAWATATAFDMTVAIVPSEYRQMTAYVKPGSRTVTHNVFDNTRAVVLKTSAISTYASGTSFLRFYSTDVGQAGLKSTETTPLLLFDEVGGATATNKIFDLGVPVGIIGRTNEKFVARLDNSAAMSAALLKVSGYFQRFGNPQ